MAGCKKADRNRKSHHNMYYKSIKKWELNKTKRIEKEAKKQAKVRAEKDAGSKTKRGTARRHRRSALRLAYASQTET
jgi:hypothetical protein